MTISIKTPCSAVCSSHGRWHLMDAKDKPLDGKQTQEAVRRINGHDALITSLTAIADILEHDIKVPPCAGSDAPAEDALGIARNLLAKLAVEIKVGEND